MPSKILLIITPPHFGETCSQDKGQIPQLSPRGALQLAGAFHCSLVFFYHFLHSFILNDWQVPEGAELSLALGLCTATSFLCLELHRNLPSPPFRSQLKCHRGKAVLAAELGWVFPQGPLLSPVWECIPLKWSSFSTTFHCSWRPRAPLGEEGYFIFHSISSFWYSTINLITIWFMNQRTHVWISQGKEYCEHSACCLKHTRHSKNVVQWLKEGRADPHPRNITLKKKIIWEMVSNSNVSAPCDIILSFLPRKRSGMRSECVPVA